MTGFLLDTNIPSELTHKKPEPRVEGCTNISPQERPLRMQQRKAMMAFAPSTVQCILVRSSRVAMVTSQPAWRTPEGSAKAPSGGRGGSASGAGYG
jgi:hypothetical protein